MTMLPVPEDHAVKPRVVIFGDSHYACLRRAHIRGLVDVSDVDLEHWGHVGRRFNNLAFQDGAIHPTDDFTASRFARFNEKGRRFLPAADFDFVLIIGARTYLDPVFRSLLLAAAKGPFITSGLKRRMVRDYLHRHVGYRFACQFAATGTARILMSAVAFPTEGSPRHEKTVGNTLRPATAEELAEIWQIVTATAAADGITLIPQPPETIVDGVFTRADYAVDDHLAKNDFAHRNAAYGALILTQAMAVIRAGWTALP
jgi:hypothetical protein